MGKCISCKVRKFCRQAGYKSKRVRKLLCKRPGGRTCVKKGSIACHQCKEPLEDSLCEPKIKISLNSLITSISSIGAKAMKRNNTASCPDSEISSTSAEEEEFEVINPKGVGFIAAEDDRVEKLLSSLLSESPIGSPYYFTASDKHTNNTDSSDDYECVSKPEEKPIEIIKSIADIKATICDSITEQGCDLDYPICSKCTNIALAYVEDQLAMEEVDYHQYCAYLKKLENETVGAEIENLKKELKALRDEEESLHTKLKTVQEEEAATIKMIDHLKKEGEELTKREDKCCLKYSKYHKTALDLRDEFESVENQLNYIRSHLKKINSSNTFETTFQICYLRDFATINSFRLGRLPSAPVSWSEINIAWGQVALMLSALGRKMNFNFKKYKLVPYGDHSFIEIESEKRVVPLFGKGGTRLMWHTATDEAMVAFLNCLWQLEKQLQQKDKQMKLPYSIEMDRLIDFGSSIAHSIRTQFNSEEEWTRSLKFLLTNLRWSIFLVCKMFMDEENDNNAN